MSIRILIGCCFLLACSRPASDVSINAVSVCELVASGAQWNERRVRMRARYFLSSEYENLSDSSCRGVLLSTAVPVEDYNTFGGRENSVSTESFNDAVRRAAAGDAFATVIFDVDVTGIFIATDRYGGDAAFIVEDVGDFTEVQQ